MVINCQMGDRKAFELLVKRWHPRILRRVYYTTKDATASRDIAQEVWMAIINRIKTLQDPRTFEVWSLKIANNKAVDWIRSNQLERKREEVREFAQHAFAEKGNEQNEDQLQNLKIGLSKLTEEHRLIIQLFYHEDLSIVAISQLLDIPIGTVKSRLFTARKELKNLLTDKI